MNLKSLVIFDVLKEHGDEAVKMLSKKFGIPVVFKQVDVRDARSVQAAVDSVCLPPLLHLCIGTDYLGYHRVWQD